jgi:RHS repeat-associated protein
VLSDEQVTSLNNPGDVLWPLTDNLGTVRDLATYDSQQDETTVANHRTFDAYGNLTSQTNSAVDHLFAFTGRQLDEATGMQNNLNRWYDASVGRWLSQDPIGFAPRDGNLYRYVRNEATIAGDPNGLDPHYSPLPGTGVPYNPYPTPPPAQLVPPWDPSAKWWFGIPNPFAPPAPAPIVRPPFNRNNGGVLCIRAALGNPYHMFINYCADFDWFIAFGYIHDGDWIYHTYLNTDEFLQRSCACSTPPII